MMSLHMVSMFSRLDAFPYCHEVYLTISRH
jgi:hypothetical protein